MRGQFVGVGVSRYDHGHVPLPHAITDVQALRALLGEQFDGEPLCNPYELEASAHLHGVKGALPDGGPLVVQWSGGGLVSAGSLRLLARDSGNGPADGLAIGEHVVVPCAASGANQLLFIVDTCFAGAAVAGTDLAAAILREQPPDGPVWVGVLGSCQPAETARDGAFGRVLRRVLAYGPATPELRLRWSAHNRYVRGDDVCDAVLKEWGGRAHRPDFQGRGDAQPMFANPLYRPGAPDRVVEHLLLAARGAVDPDWSWFTGRTAEVDRVVSWVRAGRPGVYLVTGSAGTGKSAIAGRVVSTANPAERARLLAQSPLGHADAGEGSVHAHVHARGLTADRVAEVLGDQLVSRGVLGAQSERRNAAELVGQVQRAVEGGATPPVVVIDGLDEARDQAFGIAEDLVSRLARHAMVIVSTREMPRARGELSATATGQPGQDMPRGDGKLSLVGTLTPIDTIDLDDPAVRESGRADLRRYLVARLTEVSGRMDPDLVADHVAGTASMTGDRPFLLARLVADQLRATPVDTSAPAWPARISASVEAAFDTDIARVAEPAESEHLHSRYYLPAMLPKPAERADVPEPAWWAEVFKLVGWAGLPRRSGPTGVARAWRLLTALTWAFGAGLPEDDWLTIADALPVQPGEPPGAPPCDRDDLTWVLDRLGRYIVQDGEAGVAVYRLAHQTLADHLRPPYQPSHDRPFDPAALPVATALLTRYATLLAAAVDPTTPPYLWHHTHRHVATAGPIALDALRALTADHPTLVPDVALAALTIGDQFGHWGRRSEAVAPAEEAVGLYRGLAKSDPAFPPGLAMALNNLSVHYRGLGRRAEAVASAEEGVRVSRGLAESNRAFRPGLATALNNLGACYGEAGRRAEAVAPIDAAVKVFRDLVVSDPAFRPDLAGALNNLGLCYSGVWRSADAVAPTEEAVSLYRDLAETNPAFLPNLAAALNNLGVCYRGVLRWADAIVPTQEAVSLYRGLAETNPAFQLDLAGALNNLAGAVNNLDTHDGEMEGTADAVAPTEEAVRLYRELAGSNPASLWELATALTKLGMHYGEVGRKAEAVAPSEEAARLQRDLAETDPAFGPDLAGALYFLGIRYRDVDRWAEAIDATEEAVALYRDAVESDPMLLMLLAAALTGLDRYCAQVGEPERAESAWQATVTVVRDTDAAFLYADRAEDVEPGHLHAVWWLVEALRLDRDDPYTIHTVHTQVRRHRDANPAGFDAAWSEHTGAPPPEWLLGDPALSAVSRDDAGEATYRPLLLSELAREFVLTDLASQRTLLAERRDDLLSDIVRSVLADMADDGTGAVFRARALVNLAVLDEHEPLFDALNEPDRFPALLADLAIRPDPIALYHSALAAFTAAATRAEEATGGLYLAIAAAVGADLESAVDILTNARTFDPDRSDDWILILAQVSRIHPEVLPLIPAMAAPPATAEPSGEDS